MVEIIARPAIITLGDVDIPLGDAEYRLSSYRPNQGRTVHPDYAKMLLRKKGVFDESWTFRYDGQTFIFGPSNQYGAPSEVLASVPKSDIPPFTRYLQVFPKNLSQDAGGLVRFMSGLERTINLTAEGLSINGMFAGYVRALPHRLSETPSLQLAYTDEHTASILDR